MPKYLVSVRRTDTNQYRVEADNEAAAVARMQGYLDFAREENPDVNALSFLADYIPESIDYEDGDGWDEVFIGEPQDDGPKEPPPLQWG